MTISVLWLFLTVPWVDLQCVLVVFPGQTHSLFVFDPGFVAWFFVTIIHIGRESWLLYHTIANAENLVRLVFGIR